MMPEFLKRLKEMIDREGISIRSFEMNCGITNGTVSRTIKNNKNFQIQVLLKISEKHPRWNMNYLISGTLPVFHEDSRITQFKNEDFLMSVADLGEAVKRMAESIQS